MNIQERAGLSWHLSGNLYPPQDEFFDTAIAAIAYFREGVTPEGAPQPGYVAAPAGMGEGAWLKAEDVIRNLRLEFYLEAEDAQR